MVIPGEYFSYKDLLEMRARLQREADEDMICIVTAPVLFKTVAPLRVVIGARVGIINKDKWLKKWIAKHK